MPNKNNQISDSGVASTSGLEVYMTVTIGSVEYLVNVVANDRFGNSHTVLRRDNQGTIED